MKMSLDQCHAQNPTDSSRKVTFNSDLDDNYPTEIFALPVTNDPESQVEGDEPIAVIDTYKVFDNYGQGKETITIHEGVDADEELRGYLLPDLVVVAMDALERVASGSPYEMELMQAHDDLRASLLKMHMVRAQARNALDRDEQAHLRPLGIC